MRIYLWLSLYFFIVPSSGRKNGRKKRRKNGKSKKAEIIFEGSGTLENEPETDFMDIFKMPEGNSIQANKNGPPRDETNKLFGMLDDALPDIDVLARQDITSTK